ncbi:hypothetical protein D3C87_1210890 [compost metagenome]
MTSRLLQEFMGLEPAGRPLMQVQASGLGQTGKAPQQELPGQRVDTHPFTVHAFDKNRRCHAQLLQAQTGLLVAAQGDAQGRMQHLQQRNADQKFNLFGRQVGDQGVDKIASYITGPCRQLFDRRDHARAFFDGSDRQLQAQ